MSEPFMIVQIRVGSQKIMYSRFTPNREPQRTFSTAPKSCRRFCGMSETV